MPPIAKLALLARLATLPETRGLILAASRSETVRDVARRARSDRAGLVRELSDPATAKEMIRSAVMHPATRELASVGLFFVPARYGPLGWAAMWAGGRVGQRVYRRVLDPPTEVVDGRRFRPRRPQKDVTPRQGRGTGS